MLWKFLLHLSIRGLFELLQRWVGGPRYLTAAIVLAVAAALGAAIALVVKAPWKQRIQSEQTPD